MGGRGWWGGECRHKQSIIHLPSIITTVICSLRTSSGHCGLRSDSTRPPSEPPGGRGSLPFLTGPLLRPALNQPLVFMSAELQPQDKAVSRFEDKGVACPLRSLLQRGEIGEEGRGVLPFF